MADPTAVSRASSMARHAVAFVVFSAFSLTGMIFALGLLPWRALRVRMGNVLGRQMSRIVLWIAGIRITGDAREVAERAPAIFVTNHASNADPWMGMVVCPVGGCGIAKREVLRIPFLGWAYWLLGHLLIDRSKSSEAVQAMRELATFVQHNNLSVWLWPEGTQPNDGRLLPFKRGFVHLAIATGLPVVPVIFHDAHVVWPARSTVLRPGSVAFEVLDTIDTAGWTADTAAEHASEVHDVFVSRLRPSQRPVAE